MLLADPTGGGKGLSAQSLGDPAIMAGYTAGFLHAYIFFSAMSQSRVDNSVDHTLRSFFAPDLFNLDDLGLHRLTGLQ